MTSLIMVNEMIQRHVRILIGKPSEGLRKKSQICPTTHPDGSSSMVFSSQTSKVAVTHLSVRRKEHHLDKEVKRPHACLIAEIERIVQRTVEHMRQPLPHRTLVRQIAGNTGHRWLGRNPLLAVLLVGLLVEKLPVRHRRIGLRRNVPSLLGSLER